MFRAIHRHTKLFSLVAFILLFCGGLRVAIPIVHHHDLRIVTTHHGKIPYYDRSHTDREDCLICHFISNLYDETPADDFSIPIRPLLVLSILRDATLYSQTLILPFNLRAPPLIYC